MTVAVCTNCGKMKWGALCPCPLCEDHHLDVEISILLSDHNLSENELNQIGGAIHVIHGTGLDEEKRFHLLTYFLSRKWPKLIGYDIDAADPRLRKVLDDFYRAQLARLPGQNEPDLKVSSVRRHTWNEANGEEFQEEDDLWQAEVRGILLNGMGVARLISSLGIEAGEGAVLQRVTHFAKELLHGCDYLRLAGRATELVGDASEYRRRVDAFCSKGKNGWSARTLKQAAYFRGLCQRLEEMAKNTQVLIKHKAGINPMIPLDVTRVRQEFTRSYDEFINLSHVVLDPARINPE